MSLVIHKYPLHPNGIGHLPSGARILSVQAQRGNPYVWALVDPTKPFVEHFFEAVPTGEAPSSPDLEFLGTVQLDGGGLVFHIFHRIGGAA